MESDENARPAERLRVALEMHDLGVEVMRQNLRRRNPGAPEEAILAELARWLRASPGEPAAA